MAAPQKRFTHNVKEEVKEETKKGALPAIVPEDGGGTFDHFARLPMELRWHIWDLAVRDDRPGAHFLTTWRRRLPHIALPMDRKLRCTINGYNDDNEVYQHWAPKPPGLPDAQGESAAGYSWTEGNRSAYMVDGGLWRACHESRRAVIRSLKRRGVWKANPKVDDPTLFETAARSGQLGTDGRHRRYHACSTGYFHGPGGERQYFTIRPGDLVLFQPVYSISTVPWGIIDIRCFFERIWSHGTCAATRSSLHYALAYDPCWDNLHTSWGSVMDVYYGAFSHYDEEDVRGWAQLSLNNKWLVDHRLRRTAAGISSCKKTDVGGAAAADVAEDRQVFYGMGCRFVEVWHDDELDRRRWEYQDGSPLVVKGMLTLLNHIYGQHNSPDGIGGETGHRGGPFRLLAYEVTG